MIYLHIGRNKAGSTTLQDIFSERHHALHQAGVRYLHFGHLADSDPRILGFANMPELAGFVRQTGETVLVSNEFMSAWARPYTEAVAQALAGLKVQVLVYLRDYTQWLPSLFAQDVKNGDDARDFDAYAEAWAPRVSAWPMLQDYAAGFGWDRLRIRALDRRALEGGDVVQDAFHALGLDPRLAEGAGRRSNASPGWMSVEMIRAARRLRGGALWDARTAQEASALAARLPDSPPPTDPDAGYLTARQIRWLADLYDEDVARIAERTGVNLPRALRIQAPRAGAPPSWRNVPVEIVRAWAARSTVRGDAAALIDELAEDHAREATL